MKYVIHITPTAEAEIAASFQWIAAISPTSALRWIGRLRERIATLKSYPKRWSEAPEAAWYGSSLRLLLIGKRPHVYRVPYEIQGNIVYVLRIRHGRQNVLQPGEL